MIAIKKKEATLKRRETEGKHKEGAGALPTEILMVNIVGPGCLYNITTLAAGKIFADLR